VRSGSWARTIWHPVPTVLSAEAFCVATNGNLGVTSWLPVGGGGVLVEWESPVPSSGSVLGSNPTKAFGFFCWRVVCLKKGNLPFALPEKQVWAMPFMVTQASSVMMSSPSSTNGAQDLHENLLSIGDAAFPGLSNQNELNWTDCDLLAWTFYYWCNVFLSWSYLLDCVPVTTRHILITLSMWTSTVG